MSLHDQLERELLALSHRALVTDYFLFGVIFSGLVLVVLLVASRFGTLHPPEASGAIATGRRLGAVHWGLIAFAVVLLSRVLIVDRIVDPSFLYSDEQLDSCICPLQMKLGLPTWANFSNFIHYTSSRLLLDALGFHPTALRVFQAIRFAIAVGVFVALLLEPHGRWPVLIVGGLLVASYPFLLHSLWSMGVGSGGLPALFFLALLLRRQHIAFGAASVMGAVLAASLYVYPGATLAIGSALLCHVLWYRERWNLRRIALVAASALATKLILDALYQVPFVSSRYGGGTPSLGYLTEAWTVTPLDFFYRSTSWATLNFGGPYFEPVMLWTFVLALVTRARFFWFALCAFVLNVLLVGFTGPYPGARRAMWSLPLLYLACVQSSLLFAGRGRRIASTVKGALLVSLVCLGARDWTIAAKHFPVYPPDAFYPAAVAFLAEHAPLEAEIVLFESERGYLSHAYWCSLAFTRGLWKEGGAPTLLKKGQRHPKSERDYWVLMQPTDSLADVSAAFGSGSQWLIHPPSLPRSQRFMIPNPNPLRVLRVVRPRP